MDEVVLAGWAAPGPEGAAGLSQGSWIHFCLGRSSSILFFLGSSLSGSCLMQFQILTLQQEESYGNQSRLHYLRWSLTSPSASSWCWCLLKERQEVSNQHPDLFVLGRVWCADNVGTEHSCLSAGGLYLILSGFLVCGQIIGHFLNFCYVTSRFITGKAVSVSLLKCCSSRVYLLAFFILHPTSSFSHPL